ncbi:MAG TPA: hypothetical protein VF017_10615 [Thermoanaerobaculia bacterium]|nr:hypothetical protein [Thermoanaerobaculia bacterium]
MSANTDGSTCALRSQRFLVAAGLALALATPAARGAIDEVSITPAEPTPRDVIHFRVTGDPTLCFLDQFGPYLAEGEIYLYAFYTGGFITCPGPGVLHYEGDLGPLPAGTYPVTIQIEGAGEAIHRTIEVRDRSPLDLHAGRFQVQLFYAPPAGDGGVEASAVRLTDQSGYFWFFDRENIEVTVKILDGRGINGRFWLFAATLTDLGYTLAVRDTGDGTCLLSDPPDCPLYLYFVQRGLTYNIIDLDRIGSLPVPGGS